MNVLRRNVDLARRSLVCILVRGCCDVYHLNWYL